MNMNFRTLSKTGIFREVLSLYDWKHSSANQKIIQGILGVSEAKKSFMRQGQLVHGTELTARLKDGTFSEEGEQNIFGRMVSEFLSHYASINYLISLKFINEPSGKVFSWDSQQGKCHSF